MLKPINGLLVLSIVILASCATESRAQDFDELVSTAKQEILLAERTGFLWSTTEKLLKQGQAAKDAGDLNKATKLVKSAISQARLAQKQAHEQGHPDMWFPEL